MISKIVISQNIFSTIKYFPYFEIDDHELSQVAADLDIGTTKNASQLAADDMDVPEPYPIEVQSAGDTGKKMYYWSIIMPSLIVFL